MTNQWSRNQNSTRSTWLHPASQHCTWIHITMISMNWCKQVRYKSKIQRRNILELEASDAEPRLHNSSCLHSRPQHILFSGYIARLRDTIQWSQIATHMSNTHTQCLTLESIKEVLTSAKAENILWSGKCKVFIHVSIHIYIYKWITI